MLGLKRRANMTEQKMKKIRIIVHLSFTAIFLLCILVFKLIDNKSIIDVLLRIAGYTYGPLLGLFSFGILTKRHLPKGYSTLVVCLLAPVICYGIHLYGAQFLGGFQIGIEMLVLNGLITFLGLYLISFPVKSKPGVINHIS